MRTKAASIRCLLITGSVAAAFAAFAGGCSSSNSISDLRSNPTPELDTLSQRRADIDNSLSNARDTNGRLLNEDMGRFWLLDRPSRLSTTPMPY